MINHELLIKFCQGSAVIYCKTKEEAKELFIILKDANCKWSSSKKLDEENTNWDIYKEDTVYIYENGDGLMYGNSTCVESGQLKLQVKDLNMKLIDADKLKEELKKYYDMVLDQQISDDEKLAKHDMLSDVMFTINEQPTIINNYFK